MNGRLLITGADGFTGRHVMATARSQGLEAVALKSDLLDPDNLQREIDKVGAQWVLHLAAISHVAHADTQEFYRVNVVGTENLLATLARASLQPKKVVVASSANVYGNVSPSEAAAGLTEETPLRPANHYGISKLAAEQVVRLYQERLPLVVTRPFNYTGHGQAVSFLVPKLVHAYASKSAVLRLGNLDVARDFTDVRAVAEQYLALLQAAPNGTVVNLCSGVDLRLDQILAKLSELAGYRPRIEVDRALVRSQEIKVLKGNPSKLVELVGRSLVLDKFPFSQTLAWMYDKDLARSSNPGT